MDEARYVVFAAEARAQLRRIALNHERIDHRERESAVAGLESLGYQLHNLYGAIEELFELVAASFENQLQENQLQGGGGYHIELLRRMTMDVDKVRPRVISDRTLNALNSLRGFRHVFRHAYGGGLDRRRIRPACRRRARGARAARCRGAGLHCCRGTRRCLTVARRISR